MTEEMDDPVGSEPSGSTTMIDIDGRPVTVGTEAGVSPVRALLRGPARPVVAIGVFDGVHLGHRSLLERARLEAARSGVPLWALTFCPHPEAVVGRRAASSGFLLSTLAEKASLLHAAGVDQVVALRFDSDAAAVDPEGFFQRCLAQGLRASQVVVGFNFTFGSGGTGGPALLETLGRKRGIEVVVHPAVRLAGAVVSSSSVRKALASGDVEAAGLLLGRAHSLAGPVVHGAGRGTGLGFPTANVAFPRDNATPAPGVYVCSVSRGGEFIRQANRAQPAVANLGTSPTFTGPADCPASRLEVHVLEGAPPDYGDVIRVYFLRRLRPERRFGAPDDLVTQINRDRAAALAYFGRQG